jgi:hypothetical protein
MTTTDTLCRAPHPQYPDAFCNLSTGHQGWHSGNVISVDDSDDAKDWDGLVFIVQLAEWRPGISPGDMCSAPHPSEANALCGHPTGHDGAHGVGLIAKDGKTIESETWD